MTDKKLDLTNPRNLMNWVLYGLVAVSDQALDNLKKLTIKKPNYSCEKKHILLVAIEFNKNKMIKIN